MQEKPIRFFRIPELSNVELYKTTNATTCSPRHVHLVFSLSIQESGVRIHETKRGKYPVTPGSVVVVNLDELHCGSTAMGHKSSTQAIRIEPPMLNALVRDVSGKNRESVLFAEPIIEDMDLFGRIRNLCRLLGFPGSRLEKECVFLDTFARLCTRHSRDRIAPIVTGSQRIKPVLQVREFLQDCFSENVSLSHLGSLVGLSAFHLARLFTRQIGVPPHAYQTQVRLKKATNLLAAGWPIAKVALEVGYYDQSHFQRAFKKKFGITPGQYNRHEDLP